MSNIISTFVKIYDMSILGTITTCINRIPPELIDEKILYAEVDQENYDGLDAEFALVVNDSNYIFKEQKVSDFGKCKIFMYSGYKIIVALDKNKIKQDKFYIAFKTKII